MFTCIGQLMMFFGCRSEKDDYFFKNEWEPLVTEGQLLLFTAFSRDSVSFSLVPVQYVCRGRVEHAFMNS